jgi:hypothetical protein
MAHTESERKDAKLRELGFDPTAPTEQALARLRELRGRPGVEDGAIARALGGIASTEAAAMLASMEREATGALRREVRRALFRLRQRGFATPVESTPASPAPSAFAPAEPGLSAMFSPIDAEGARVVWMLKAHPRGGIARLWGLISDAEGLINARLSELTRRELRGERAEIERRAGVKMVEADGRLADFVMCEAYRRTPEDKRKQVGNFLLLRAEILAAPPPSEFEHPIYAEMRTALERDPSPELLKEWELVGWKFPADEIKTYVDEIKSIQESVLVLNRVQQDERINAVVERAIGELLTGERALALRRRLEDTAYYLARIGRAEPAGWAAAAAVRIRDGADLRRIVFFQALVRAQLGAVFAKEQEKQREEPRLIVTPAEAMRAQQQARGRRR